MARRSDPARGADRPSKRPSKLSFARLVSLARPQARRLAAGTLFLFMGSAATLVFPQGIRQVVDGPWPVVTMGPWTTPPC